MSKHSKRFANAKGRSIDGRYYQLHRYLTRSEAWRALDCVARCAYLELAERYNGSNNGRIPFSIRELTVALGVGNDTVVRVLRDLEKHGFIVCTFKGGFTQKAGERRASEWRLTEFPCHVNNSPPTKDFLKIIFNNTVRPQEPDGSATGTERFGHRNRDLQNGAGRSRFGPATGTASDPSGSATGALLANQWGEPDVVEHHQHARVLPATGRSTTSKKKQALGVLGNGFHKS